MTRKHFRELARELAYVRPSRKSTVQMGRWRMCVNAVASVCRKNNTSFDYNRFIESCEL